MFKSFASIVAITAISIGCVAKFYPHLFFKVPNVGFILWAMTGGSLPPFIDNVPFQEGNQEWLKDGDVIVSTGAKAGTTWMLFCSHQIRVKVGFQ
jgi:allophanate hydrolase subunit 2